MSARIASFPLQVSHGNTKIDEYESADKSRPKVFIHAVLRLGRQIRYREPIRKGWQKVKADKAKRGKTAEINSHQCDRKVACKYLYRTLLLQLCHESWSFFQVESSVSS